MTRTTAWPILAAVFIAILLVWPPSGDKSLAVKFVNWVVDPSEELPVLPAPLALGQGDDPDAVEAHDSQVRQYDALYLKGGWTRTRLELKVADDPLNPATERQVLLVLGALTGLGLWRAGRR